MSMCPRGGRGALVGVAVALAAALLSPTTHAFSSAASPPAPAQPRLERLTENAEIYDNGDGTHTARIHAMAVNYRDASGTFRRVDPRVDAVDGGFQNRGGPLAIRFAAQSHSPALVTVKPAHGGNWSIAFRADRVAQGRAAQASENRLTYPEAFGPAALEYTVLPEGIKETIRLDAPPPADFPSQFDFPMRLTNLDATADAAGGIAFVNGDGVQASIPNGLAFDSSGTGAASPVVVSLAGAPGAPIARLTVDEAWLRDAARVFPVTIDPSLTAGRQSGHWDTFAHSGCTGCNYNAYVEANAYSIKIGRNPTTFHEYYAYMKYGLEAVAGKQILSGQWRAYFYDSPAGATYRLYPAAGPWEDHSLTWANQPGHRPESVTKAGPAPNNWSNVDITTWVRNWTSNAWPSFGVSVDTAGLNHLFRTGAAEQYWKGEDHHLEIIYNTVPNAPSDLSPTGGAETSTLAPVLSALHKDGDTDAATCEFKVYDSAGGLRASVGTRSTAHNQRCSGQVPEGAVVAAQSYTWTARAWDGNAWSPTSTGSFLAGVLNPPVTELGKSFVDTTAVPLAGVLSKELTPVEKEVVLSLVRADPRFTLYSQGQTLSYSTTATLWNGKLDVPHGGSVMVRWANPVVIPPGLPTGPEATNVSTAPFENVTELIVNVRVTEGTGAIERILPGYGSIDMTPNDPNGEPVPNPE